MNTIIYNRYPLLILLIILLSLNYSRAQELKVPIEINDKSVDNMVGRSLVYHIREGIRKSSEMRLTIDNETKILVAITTTPEHAEKPNVSCIYSAIWMLSDSTYPFPLYLYSVIGSCGSESVQSSADNIVAETDKLFLDIKKLVNKLKSNK